MQKQNNDLNYKHSKNEQLAVASPRHPIWQQFLQTLLI